MIEIAIIMLAICFIAFVVGGTIYLSHTRSQVEETKRLVITEGTKKQVVENQWQHEQNERERLSQEREQLQLKMAEHPQLEAADVAQPHPQSVDGLDQRIIIDMNPTRHHG